jgi:hypothetical protein
MTMTFEDQRQWSADRARRLAIRVEQQRLRHEADPLHVPLAIPVDDEEFPSEAFTAGWQQEEGS